MIGQVYSPIAVEVFDRNVVSTDFDELAARFRSRPGKHNSSHKLPVFCERPSSAVWIAVVANPDVRG